jgi:hypothetical protein
MAVVDSSVAEAHAKRLQTLIQERIAATMPKVAEAVTLSALSRAPTVDEEYAELMAGEGGTVEVPREGNQSADTDGRIRLHKLESTYLENAIPNPENRMILENSVSFGNLFFLNECTKFSYYNKQYIDKHTTELSEEHVVGPYFNGIEYGASANIVPVFILANGHSYPLRPANEPDPGVPEMVKSFSVHYMFNPASLESAARGIIKTALAELVA